MTSGSSAKLKLHVLLLIKTSIEHFLYIRRFSVSSYIRATNFKKWTTFGPPCIKRIQGGLAAERHGRGLLVYATQAPKHFRLGSQSWRRRGRYECCFPRHWNGYSRRHVAPCTCSAVWIIKLYSFAQLWADRNQTDSSAVNEVHQPGTCSRWIPTLDVVYVLPRHCRRTYATQWPSFFRSPHFASLFYVTLHFTAV